MAKKAKKKATDKYQLVADQLLTILQAGTKPWKKSWATTSYCNAATGHRYSGLNPVLAEISLMSRGYQSTLFVGFGQAKDLGLSMKKGSKATWLLLGGRGKKEEVDNKAFFRAYGQAQAAANLLLETAGMQLEEPATEAI